VRAINKIVVHCSDSPDDRDIGFLEIDSWHKDRGWKSPSGVHCGYHFMIRRNGTVEVGRMVNEIGAHVEGENADSVGVCLVGSKDFAAEQFAALRWVVTGLLAMFPEARVYEHREFESAKRQGKTCPNFDVHKVLEE